MSVAAVSPLLARRDSEIKTLADSLSAAQAGKGRPAVLIGPRSNGKTVLLGEFARMCRERVKTLGVPGLVGAEFGRMDPAGRKRTLLNLDEAGRISQSVYHTA